MKFTVAAAMLVLVFSACGPDNPFGPDDPTYSALTGVAQNSTTAKLSWNACPDSDFASYTLYRSSSSGIQNNPGSAAVVATYDKYSTTQHLDQNLQPGATWYYALKVANDSGGTSWSNEAYIKLPGSLGHLTNNSIKPLQFK